MILLCALFLPLLSFVSLIAFGRKLSRQGDWLAIATAGISFGCAVAAFAQVFPDRNIHYQTDWFTVYVYEFKVGLLLDKLSAVMLVLVTFVSWLVQLYSTVYMKNDARYSRYFAYLGLFTFAMLGLVLADSLFLLYFFWELVGLSSYLLIGFWYGKPKAYRASRNAFIINRIGDAGLLLAIILVYMQFGTTDMVFLLNDAVFPENTLWMTAIGFGLFCGAAAKSAQFPLSIWLPPAMAGPTPVSALIHAATMVAAGVFLLVRGFPFLEDTILNIIAVIGSVTAFLGAFAALFQQDIKKVLAYSTVSQLGYMMAAVGVGAPEAALFHLVTHAFFKAGLFLCAGSVIDALHKAARRMRIADPDFDVQDMRNMGGLRRQMPFTFVCYVICGLALAGLPLTSGFLSKDLILSKLLFWSLQSETLDWRFLMPVLGFLGILFTALYVGRQLKLIFGGRPRYFALYDGKLTYINDLTEESPGLMRGVMGVLALLSLFFWFAWIPWEAGDGWFFKAFTQTAVENNGSLVGRFFESLNATVAHNLALIFSLAVVPLGLLLALWRTGKRNWLMPSVVRRLSLNFLYAETGFHFCLARTTFAIKRLTAWLDKNILDKTADYVGVFTVTLAHITGWADRFLVDGTVNAITYSAARVGWLTKSIAGSRVQSLFSAALFGLLLMLAWVILK